eukprot:CAMPEP_0118967764 /NCGR_PEP_ID=MMETSP1173-20130426/5108_1 /TAXON_ID=1034831 /ORGANISM="Rhizochromulina marina cf, Strain CCMP1243" /LENGTH=79 /DNA_ID=CAMNT_0006916787 /DNA_START=62 /DNA_END=298 /DNA_ORIENTATION=-
MEHIRCSGVPPFAELPPVGALSHGHRSNLPSVSVEDQGRDLVVKGAGGLEGFRLHSGGFFWVTTSRGRCSFLQPLTSLG